MNLNESKFFDMDCHNDMAKIKTSQRSCDCKTFSAVAQTYIAKELFNKIYDFLMVYECANKTTKNTFIPDITIYRRDSKEFIQVELKFKESRSRIIKEINGMRDFAGKEFWYVIGNEDYWHIKRAVKNTKVKILSIDEYEKEIKLLKKVT